jgi:hypothetical protein
MERQECSETHLRKAMTGQDITRKGLVMGEAKAHGIKSSV